jgi:D-alanyl-D-alanine carboxypeptidase
MATWLTRLLPGLLSPVVLVLSACAVMETREALPPPTPPLLSGPDIEEEVEYRSRVNEVHARLGIKPDMFDADRLPLQREAEDLVAIGNDPWGRPQRLTPEAAKAWEAMRRAAATDGIELQVLSGFRSVDYQKEVVRRRLERDESLELVLRVNTPPGHSEHHTGRAVDIVTPEHPTLTRSFADTPAYRWLVRHAARFGFVESYPEGGRGGVIHEPWHWLYVGDTSHPIFVTDQGRHAR